MVLELETWICLSSGILKLEPMDGRLVFPQQAGKVLLCPALPPHSSLELLNLLLDAPARV
jgi:hypothetical protein